MNLLKTLALAAALTLPAVANAAPLWSVTGGTTYDLPSLGGVSSFNPNVANQGNGLNELIGTFAGEGLGANPQVTVGGALNLLSNTTSLIFTFFGREAGAFNSAFDAGVASILTTGNAVGNSFATGAVAASSPLPFRFQSDVNGGTSVVNGSAGAGAQIAFLLSPFLDNVVWAFFDDGGGSQVGGCATKDCDFDDMIVRISGNVAPVPLPAALPLFATAIGGLGLLGRWRRRRLATTQLA